MQTCGPSSGAQQDLAQERCSPPKVKSHMDQGQLAKAFAEHTTRAATWGATSLYPRTIRAHPNRRTQAFFVPDPGLSFLGNAMADALAELGAQDEAYPSWLRQDIIKSDELGRRVRSRLLCIAAKRAADQGATHPQPRPAGRGVLKKARLEGTALRKHVHDLGLASGHAVSVGACRVSCSTCKQSSTLRQSLRGWLAVACFPSGFPGIHPSHLACRHRGIVFCKRCGCWAKGRIVKLARQCAPATVAGLAALRALGKGKCPPGLPSWPS